jgi:hypothetical protein
MNFYRRGWQKLKKGHIIRKIDLEKLDFLKSGK